ncbi:hypothetical protein D0T49_13015 [Paludibacter sp. 221]|uniref:hypothetical protein n=1 Tax=Paludibacter sp. 221 TaxID=2302939 RepID=UPI0013D55ED7|nr:hypothetical protein [Paludibacter sp. 221]NDV47964.1 hypothetical protein [Paludibacter sp. 221]
MIKTTKHYLAIYFLFSLVIVTYSCSKNKNKKDELAESTIEKIIIDIEKNNINQKITNQFVFLGNDSLNSVKLNNYIKNNKPIFFYFSSYSCSPCIDRTIEILEKTYSNYKTNNNIVFISPDYPKRFRENCYGKPLLTLEYFQLGIPVEERGFDIPPFFFILNNDLKIESIHVVNKLDFYRTEQYLKEIKLRLQI